MPLNIGGKVTNVVIDYDFIVNTEVGLIRFIRENFQDSRVFELNILNKSDREILSLLYSRKNYNPLSIISTEDNLKDIDGLYKSFFTNYKTEIIKKAVVDKNIKKFVSTAVKLGPETGTKVSIGVKDNIEREDIIKHFGNVSFIDVNNTKSLLLIDAFYARDYTFFTNNSLGNMKNKKIYISPMLFNILYFNENPFTDRNEIMVMGHDYSSEEENNGEN